MEAVEPFSCCRRARSRRETARPTVVGQASPGPPEFGIYATNQGNSNKNRLIEPQLSGCLDLVLFYWGRIVLVQKEAAPAAPLLARLSGITAGSAACFHAPF
ncbi:hypothetical protein DF020_30455 [Burkholderia cenocepacia]|nr:hypothetical protein DF020_30455 [Burkholderia cenocepacia]